MINAESVRSTVAAGHSLLAKTGQEAELITENELKYVNDVLEG